MYGAALLLGGGYCSDDGFEYFRSWLISRGSATFQQALDDPDSLADQKLAIHDGLPDANFEDFAYVAGEARQKMTGLDAEDFYEAVWIDSVEPPPDADEESWETPEDSVLQRTHPRLWQKYGALKQRNDADYTEQAAKGFPKLEAAGVTFRSLKNGEGFFVKGIGDVAVGGKIAHKTFGVGVVLSMLVFGESGTSNMSISANIKFSESEGSYMLSADHFLPSN
jgi:hypothetical protein